MSKVQVLYRCAESGERYCPYCNELLTLREQENKWYCPSCDLYTIGYVTKITG